MCVCRGGGEGPGGKAVGNYTRCVIIWIIPTYTCTCTKMYEEPSGLTYPWPGQLLNVSVPLGLILFQIISGPTETFRNWPGHS